MISSLPLSGSATRTAPGRLAPRVSRAAAAFEENAAAWALLAMMLLPLAEVVVRRAFVSGIPGAASIVQHLTLWVGLLGAGLAARDNRLLALGTATLLRGRARRAAAVYSSSVAVAVTTGLFWGGLQLIATEMRVGAEIALHLPVWLVQLVLPAGFAIITLRLIRDASDRLAGRCVAASGVVIAMALLRYPGVLGGTGNTVALLVVIVAGIAGAPIFVLLGGAALVLFAGIGLQPVAVLIETYSLVVSPTLPAVPLFTLAGFVLAEGHASRRLLRLFRAWFGWIPGGSAVACAVLCSFFTVFTGGSGVTILALGGLLFPALLRDGYRDRFALGLLTASGSLGLLLPPALPLIVYAVIAVIPVEDLFLGGVVPGLVLTSAVALWGIREGVVRGAARTPFRLSEARASLWAAKWEALMPVVVVASIFSGWATPIEAAAVTAFYAVVTQAGAHRELSINGDLRRVLCQCAALVGGVLIILGVAVGLTNYMVTADVPGLLLQWTRQHVESRMAFLLALNGFLLIVGCLMDIFSATIVVVPLIVPLGAAYGVDPVHLGIIFIANLELGYLTPPVGLNLFLASYRFERPIVEVFRAVWPMLVILAVGVLLITYVPWLTTCLLPAAR
jgi:tripartite ATP-independent transporter DctM subunit